MKDSKFLFNKIGNANPSYQAIQLINIENIDFYDKFLNWTKGEFDLHLIDEPEPHSLLVYFPSGHFSIKNISKNKPFAMMEVKIESKTLDCGTKTANQITAVLKLFHKALNNQS